MFNIYFPEYFSSVYHKFPSNKPKPNQKPKNKSESSGRSTTYTPPSNSKHRNFHYCNKKRCYYFDKHNNKQKVSAISNSGPRGSWYRRYHPISTLCVDYDNSIFQSIQYWSFSDSNNHTTTSIESFVVSSIASFVDSFDVLKHYTSIQNLHTWRSSTHVDLWNHLTFSFLKGK